MPTIITHGIAAFTIGKMLKQPAKVITAGIICSMLPDLDVLSFRFGISYDSMWGHRGISHSIFAALLIAAIVCMFFKKDKRKIFVFLFLATVSHPLLDAFTNGGKGVALLAPFSSERFFAPWRPIMVSPLRLDAFAQGYGLQVFKSEIIWIWLPCSIMLLLNIFLKRKDAIMH
jgi:inner membrane protein